ncbi:dTDP-4-dehydrorhamnose reductase [Saccharopolyspora sp. HNM0986]|uniref:dTDP-4-dehydrorhamnose reductase n=1 Tax=Saccharopolyspora galaxeae TaxID=2781241 RepID=UPI00190DB6FA|nr:dTDP-4-dehydrorhamnose reductase [Saccharopolyspora sp. HNM0986]MBK0870684.1 dTDP-4-dehydrorhamnose reductase [Saccharopolyspora sp. HNM0986]
MSAQRLALLVPGGRGQLGRELARSAVPLVHAPGSGELDLRDAAEVGDAVGSFAETALDNDLRPVVVNAAAYTAVDAAESDADAARSINVDGAAALARACAARRVPLVHMSTDYVFSGDADVPYEPDDPAEPRTVYGRTKLDGERAVLSAGARACVVRTAWVYGAGGQNFVRTMSRLERERDSLSVVDDQVGAPTWTGDLAAGVVQLAGSFAERRDPQRPVLHCTNAGRTSWFSFARAVFAELGADPERVQPCSTEEFPLPAPRPAHSVLSGRAWAAEGLTPLRDWRSALTAAFETDGAALRR